MSLITDFRVALRSLTKVKGLTLTVVVTLALGIGANAAIFSVVRGVLLRPLVNRDEDRLIYIRQSARGIGMENANFSVPEIIDLRASVKTLTPIGDFSTIEFTMVGLGEPRVVRAGVVGGSYFEVMGLRPVLGRLLGPSDDGPEAAGAVVLTHRFWTTSLESDPSVLGKTLRLGDRSGVIVGVLEPSIPYPAETEIIANVVTSPHHLDATMVHGRVHRMSEIFGRLAPGSTLDEARAELRTAHRAILEDHPEAYPKEGDFQIDAVRMRDQIVAPARTILLVLLGASALVFVIACSNVANLILARSVRREGELAIRAALGAGAGALRRTLLAESLVLCGAGAVLGVAIARPMVAVLARYASRFSVRALDITVDATLLWVGVTLALTAAILLAFVPRLPSADPSHGLGVTSGSVRVTSGANRRLRLFAVTQIAASFVLLVGAGMLLATLVALQRVQTGFDTNVLAIDVPVISFSRPRRAGRDVLQGSPAPHRRGARRRAGRDRHHRAVARRRELRTGLPVLGRGLRQGERRGGPARPLPHRLAGVLRLARRSHHRRSRLRRAGRRRCRERRHRQPERRAADVPHPEALNRQFMWTDPVMDFIGMSKEPRRIIGIAADVDDENIVPGPAMSVYHPFEQAIGGGRLFVHAAGDPYALVSPITRIIREIEPEQPVERAATLGDVRAEVLAPNRLNALVFGGFAGVALTIAVVGVAGVLAFSVSARMREFGIRLAMGSTPRNLMTRVLREGAVIAGLGIVAGAVVGGALVWVVGRFFVGDVETPGALPVVARRLSFWWRPRCWRR